MRLGSAVRTTSSAARSVDQVGPFNFFHSEQEAMGKAVMSTTQGPETLSYQEFKRFLDCPPMSESQSVKETLEALRNAENSEDLPGRERLVEVQNHLVDLLAHVERNVGCSVYHGERKKCQIQRVGEP